MSTFSSIIDSSITSSIIDSAEPVSSSITSSITSSISCRQLGSKQDHIIKSHMNIDSSTDSTTDSSTDSTATSYYTMIEVYDGHGENDCIDIIRSTNTVEIIVDRPYAPELALDMMLKQKAPLMPYGSGATFSCVKIFDSYVECRSVGDSEIWVFKNGVNVYKSPNHIWANLDEQARIGHRVKPIYSVKPELLSSTSITMTKSSCVQFNKQIGQLIPLQLVPTQSLGHRGITGLSPAIHRVDFTDADDLRVIIGSDGFWDMVMSETDNEFLCLCETADELCDFAEKRWKQEWDFIEDSKHPEIVEKTCFDAYDDVCVGLYRKPTV